MKKTWRVALCQYPIGPDWEENMTRAEALIGSAAGEGADLVVLPEMFMMPYDMTLIPSWAEPVPDGRTARRLAEWAARWKVLLVGGSLPEKGSDGRYYNTSPVFGPDGAFLGRHRKLHLFDVDLPDGVSFRESSILSPGDGITVVEWEGLKIGVAICYDLRFPEPFRLMALEGAHLIAAPGAFNRVSGPAHWELLIRTRAVENTLYVAGVSGLSPQGAAYDAYGHSMLADPFGVVTASMGRAVGYTLADLDPARLADIRGRLPVMSQRRTDVYRLEHIRGPFDAKLG